MTKIWFRMGITLAIVVCVYIGSGGRSRLGEAQPAASASTDMEGTYIPLGGERIWHAPPAAADFNGDGDKEIVACGYDGMLYVIAYDGATWSLVWSRQTALDINAAAPPTPTSTNQIESAPVIADIDNDGDLEIVVSTGGLPQNHLNGGLLVYGYQTDMPNWSFAIQGDWPQPKLDIVGGGSGASDPDGYWDGIFASPAVGDLDGDGDLEIVVESEDRRIHAWHHDGSIVAGWPFTRDNGDPILRGGLSSAALGDIDGDGLPEVVVGGISPRWEGEGTPADYTYSSVWAINGDSTLVAGWPQHVREWVDSSPALGDIDGDGLLEIVVGTGRNGITSIDTDEYSGGHFVHAWNHDGSVVAGWPRPTSDNMLSSPALADLDGTGGLEVIIGCGTESLSSCTYLYAWHGDGSDVSGFPMQPLDASPWPSGHQPQVQPYPPIVADIDDDGHPEILMNMRQSLGVSIVEHDGTMSTDYSRIQDRRYDALLATPLVGDVDNDGLLETVLAGVGENDQAAIYIWHETASAANDLPWPMFHHDATRSGNAYLGDTTPPQNPTVASSTHTPGVWDNDAVVEPSWSGASDQESGIAGYYYAWDTSPTTVVGLGDSRLAPDVSALSSGELSDGGDWYFHLRTRNLAGLLADDTQHLGPLMIDTLPPVSTAASPACDVLSTTVSWSGTDAGSGIASYDVEVRDGESGAWTNWMSEITQTTGVYVGTPDHSIYFRSQARDAAGNLEAEHSAADTQTWITRYSFSGSVYNTLAQPIFGAWLTPTPTVPLDVRTDPRGSYLLCYDVSVTYSLAALRSDFGALPAMQHLSGTLSGLDFYLPPISDAIQDGGFEESGPLETAVFSSAWDHSTGDANPVITGTAHTGHRAAQLNGPGLSAISQTVTIPADDGQQPLTLSWLYLAQLPTARLTLEIEHAGPTRILELDTDVGKWTHGYMDVSDLAGQQVTLRFVLSSTASLGMSFLPTFALLDSVSLGPTKAGVEHVYLPIILRQ